MSGSPQQITSAFQNFDENGDGVISREELAALMAKLGGLSPRSLDQLLAAMDTSGDGNVNYREFVAFCFQDTSPANVARLPGLLFTYAQQQVVGDWNIAAGTKFQLTSGFSFAGWVRVGKWMGDCDRVFEFGTASIPSARLHRNGDSTLRIAFNALDLCDFPGFWPAVGQWVHIAVSVNSEGTCTAYRDGCFFQTASFNKAPCNIQWCDAPNYYVGKSSSEDEPDSDMAMCKLGWYGTALPEKIVSNLASDSPERWESQHVKELMLANQCMPKLQAFSRQELVPRFIGAYRHRRTRVDETHRRAMTLPQLFNLGEFIQDILASCEIVDPHPTFSVGRIAWQSVNLYHICDLFVIPMTTPCRCAFMELVAEGPQDPWWFMSHWWGTPFRDTLEMLRFHNLHRRQPPTIPYWICTFANNQHDLSELNQLDLRQTPFVRAIMSPTCQGTVMIMDKTATPFRRSWCTLENYVTTTTMGKKLDIAALIDENSQSVLDEDRGWMKIDSIVPALLTDDGSGNLVRSVGDSRVGLQFPPQVAHAAVRTDICSADASNISDKKAILRLIAGETSSDVEPPSSSPHYDKVNLAIRRIFGPGALRGAALNCDVEEARRLLEVGLGSVTDEDHTGRTPLTIAAQNLTGEADESRRVPLVQLLLKFRANPNHVGTDLGITPLHRASFWNLPETVDLLVNARADPNVQRHCDCRQTHPGGLSPLHVAISNGSASAVARLIKLGAKVEENVKEMVSELLQDLQHGRQSRAIGYNAFMLKTDIGPPNRASIH
ncbi:unnamed protein product [Polarella glacialis]|uniref:EF-hand domain-containing protein n=1 Tax=Polarella glacialis TaxID=89957 RepID=A0A813F9M9_POLGL|nr:unnamed protein product [Polarella glacialis]CAE8676998.1 unnamed protein product [Polarella glacialis]